MINCKKDKEAFLTELELKRLPVNFCIPTRVDGKNQKANHIRMVPNYMHQTDFSICEYPAKPISKIIKPEK